MEALKKLRTTHEYTTSVLEFIGTLESKFNDFGVLLGSKNASDVTETIDFFATAYEFQLPFGEVRSPITLLPSCAFVSGEDVCGAG